MGKLQKTSFLAGNGLVPIPTKNKVSDIIKVLKLMKDRNYSIFFCMRNLLLLSFKLKVLKKFAPMLNKSERKRSLNKTHWSSDRCHSILNFRKWILSAGASSTIFVWAHLSSALTGSHFLKMISSIRYQSPAQIQSPFLFSLFLYWTDACSPMERIFNPPSSHTITKKSPFVPGVVQNNDGTHIKIF